MRTKPELSRLEKLLDEVLSFDFYSFFLVVNVDFSLLVSESTVIVEVSASAPEPSCPTCPTSREFKLAADGGEATEVVEFAGGIMMEGLSMVFAAVTVAGVAMGLVAAAAVSSLCRRSSASFSFSCCSVAAAMASSTFLWASASLDLVGIGRTEPGLVSTGLTAFFGGVRDRDCLEYRGH